MTRLTLICHAATAAVSAARFPEDEDIDHAVAVAGSIAPLVLAGRWLAGPERRALSTAALISGHGNITVDQELRDWDCGRWRGRCLSDLQSREPDHLAAWMADPAARPHGGESLLDLLARTGRWLEAQSIERAKTSAVTHPAVLRAAVVKALDAEPHAFWRIDAPPLCRLHLSHDGRRWSLQGLVAPGRESS